ncbi:hypothetical protein [Wolbachia endosymbiont (group E) of Neria commutata]|uniref:hypothetical protein n=1 Tax=Wolbachia endosymbiont (group E) of Neria commutata TaxID=3066149 RepID=UPI003132A48A
MVDSNNLQSQPDSAPQIAKPPEEQPQGDQPNTTVPTAIGSQPVTANNGTPQVHCH